MISMNEALFDDLINRNYLVRIDCLDGKNCRIKFPVNKLLFREQKENLIIEYNKVSQHVLRYKSNIGIDKKFSVPEYAMRLLIFLDTVKVCKEIQYNYKFIGYYKDNKRVELETQLDILEKPKVIEKENKLVKLLELSIDTSFDRLEIVAKEEGIDEGYNLLRNFYED